jgi:glycosyltransferase involved in cell wall biosynthesis
LIPSKGLQYALAAFAGLLSCRRYQFRFDIVGDGEQRRNLEQLCTDLGLSDHVRFHGQQPYESLENFYRCAHVFLFPTLLDYRALVSFEAISAGLAMLVSVHDGSVTETVADGLNGYLFEPKDTGRLTELIKRLIDDPEKIEAFSRKSLDMAKPYTLTAAIDAIETAGELALAGRADHPDSPIRMD